MKHKRILWKLLPLVNSFCPKGDWERTIVKHKNPAFDEYVEPIISRINFIASNEKLLSKYPIDKPIDLI